jgi:hypothetical protein
VVFGGDSLTATDVAVRLGKMRLGDTTRVDQRLTKAQALAGWEEMQRMVQGCIDRVKTSAGKCHVNVRSF